jgi:hypothetical protein
MSWCYRSEGKHQKLRHEKEQVVVHEARQVRLREDVLHPLLEREVVDAPSLRAAVGQVSILGADRACCPVGVLVLSALHLGVGGVPVCYAHVHAHRDGLQGLQAMAFQDRHHFFEPPHVILLREQGAGELPDILGRSDRRFVCCHPVEHSEDNLTQCGNVHVSIGLQTTCI